MPASLAVAMGFLGFWNLTLVDMPRAWVVPTVLANVGMIVLAIWLMRVGLRDDRVRPFAVGVLYFLLWAVLRYIDLFANLGGMLGAALMFFLCGAALFGLAMFWRGRKEAKHV